MILRPAYIENSLEHEKIKTAKAFYDNVKALLSKNEKTDGIIKGRLAQLLTD